MENVLNKILVIAFVVGLAIMTTYSDSIFKFINFNGEIDAHKLSRYLSSEFQSKSKIFSSVPTKANIGGEGNISFYSASATSGCTMYVLVNSSTYTFVGNK